MSRASNRLFALSGAVLALDVVHALDHVRRGSYSSGPVRVVGFLGLGIGIAAVLATAMRARLSAPYASFYGFSIAAGFVAVHVLPHWGPLSDPFTASHVDALSWALVGVTIAAGLTLGIAGLQESRRAPAGHSRQVAGDRGSG